ncbi:MAG: UvrD-helicase domain-containing protein [Treponema sp.]|jgi:ATP-dependent exoDNAse (exonuclease V) beta subunit|nr:UvrD-helicase domain-containing protein [Treponema sp.]
MKKLNPEQIAARDAEQNVVVSAGAGSGKTMVLAERYVRLVTEGGLNVEEVLTLTFTRKAQAEMYARIYRNLASSTHPRAAEQLARFNRARISTLDSFCAAITRGGASRYGISGNFIMDEGADACRDCAVEILMRYKKEPAIRRLVAARSFDLIVDDLFSDFGMREVSFVSTETYVSLAEKQLAFLDAEKERVIESINRDLESILVLDISASGSKTAATLMEEAGKHHPLKNVRKPVSAESGKDQLKTLIEEAALFCSGGFPMPRSNAKDPALQKLRPLVESIREAAAALGNIAGTLLYREDIPVLGRIFDEYAALLLDTKRRLALLSFRDTAELALDILKHDMALRDHYKRQIKAVMIDEFQDNNRLQKELLYLVSEEPENHALNRIPLPHELSAKKLFFVGDEKQSIYRYRGADVSVFRGLSEELGGFLELNTNYRSTPELIEFYNSLFPGVFGRPEYAFEAEFRGINTDKREAENRPDGTGGGNVSPVELFLRKGETGAEGESLVPVPWRWAEALAAAERVYRLVKDGEAAWGDIALLFRSTTHQADYERVFRQAGIPFTASDPRGVYAEGPANDFYALLRLCLFPQDSNAYGAVLRSPLCAIGDETFLRIMLEREALPEPFPAEAPASWFQDEEDRARYVRGREIYERVRQKADREGIGLILAWLWYETGYQASLAADSGKQPGLDHFEYLYSLALDADSRGLSLAAFLDELAPLMGSTEKMESEAIAGGKNAVSFMTVHKSKGLEFPVVILPFSESPGMGERNSKPWYRHPEYGPAVNFKSDTARRKESAINYFWNIINEENKKKEAAELKRLFYVAATRAMKKLIIFGVEHPRSSQSFMGLLEAGFAAKPDIPHCKRKSYNLPFLKTYPRALSLLRSNVKAIGKGMEAGSLKAPTGAFTPKEPSVIRTSPSALQEAAAGGESHPEQLRGSELPDFRCESLLKGDLHLLFGTLCHRAIEILFDPEFPPEAKRDRVEREAASLFGNAGLGGTVSLLAEEAFTKAEDFLKSETGRQASASLRRASEFAFRLPLKNGATSILVKGIMDLIFEDSGHCIIVDFKTDRYRDPELHRIQLAAYRAASPAFSDLEPRIFLCYLRDLSFLECKKLTEEDLFYPGIPGRT